MAAAPTITVLAAGSAWAGPPYVTDDPEPTHTGGWENYLYFLGTNTPGATAGQIGVELNYGAAPNLQPSLMVPEDYLSSHGLRAGPGDMQISGKYRFLHAPDESWMPDAAVFPALTVPTGARNLGAGHVSLFLPIWLEKDIGKWSMFGGGGYDVNPDSGQRKYGIAGVAVTRSVSKSFSLGVELYHQTASVAGGNASTNLALGLVYQLSQHWAIMSSGGPGLEHPSRAGLSTFYLSLQFTN